MGKRHLYQAMHIIPDWWGVVITKVDINNKVFFQCIREAEKNPYQVRISIARMLWKDEALQILEKRNLASGIRSKPREIIYKRLADSVDMKTLKQQVNSLLITREGWRSDARLVSCGD